MITATILALAQDSGPSSGSSGNSPVTMIWFGLALIALTLGGLQLARYVVDLVSPRVERVRTPWTLLHVTLLLLGLVGAIAVVGFFLRGKGPKSDDIVTDLELSAAVTGCLAVGAFAIAAAFGSQGLAAFGLRASGNLRAVVAGIVTYVACIPGLIGVAIVWSVGLELLGHQVEPQAVVSGFAHLDPAERLVPFLLGAFVQPLFEEVAFRGLLQPALVQIARPLAGIAVTSILFAALHGFDAFLPIFALSMMLGWIRERTQNLGACWAVHALHNGGQLALLFLYPSIEAGKPGWLFAHA